MMTTLNNFEIQSNLSHHIIQNSLLSCDVCAIPHRVMRVPPMTVVVRAFPLGEGEARLVATGPPFVLHEASAAFPRAASRIAAIVTILWATSIHN